MKREASPHIVSANFTTFWMSFKKLHTHVNEKLSFYHSISISPECDNVPAFDDGCLAGVIEST